MDECAESPVVECRNLAKVFTDFWRRPKVRAVNELDLNVGRGEVFGLLGPNGSGKSTTIKMLLGLLNPTSGDIRVFGQSPRCVSIKHRMGYLPEESYLYKHLTPRETLDFYGRLFGLEKGLRRDRVQQLLEMVGLAHAANRPVGEFSKGMTRRIGLAQALINDPELVILDEPTSGLDPIGCRQVKDLILALAERGKTIILSSHLLADVEDVCTRVAILYNGHVRARGRIADLLEERDRIRFTVPAMAPASLEKLLSLLTERTGTEPLVDCPSMNLEQLFLDVVEKADAASETDASGVTPVGGVADFLADRDSPCNQE